MRTLSVSPCAEFPNDNGELHEGAVWVCLEVTGSPSWESPAPRMPEVAAVAVDDAVVAALEARLLEVPTPDAAADVIVLAAPEPTASEPLTDPGPPVVEAADEDDDAEIEIVDEIVMDDVIDESPAPPSPVALDDPFTALARVLEDTACAAGAGDAAMNLLRMLLGRERLSGDASADVAKLRAQAAGWQAILRGESEDFAIVGASTLDEWSSVVVAHALGEPGRADMLRRELRRRGVAAFGMIIETAA